MTFSPIFFKDDSNTFCYNHQSDFAVPNIGTHTHTTYELYYFIGGKGTYFVEGTHYPLNTHDLLITNPKELHQPIIEPNPTYHRRFIQFKKSFISPINDIHLNLFSSLDQRDLGAFNKIDAKYVTQYGIDKLFDAIEEKLKTPDKYTEFEIKLLLNQILVLIKRIFDTHLHSTPIIHKSDKIYDIIQFINENLHTTLLVEDIADHFFMNKHYLCHFFKKNTGFSIKEYITNKRIMIAKTLIQEGVPLTSVCYDVGFNNYSCFYKAFVKIENKSPKAFLNDFLELYNS